MHTHVKNKLAKALRSDQYKKAKHQLRTMDDRFCAAGVLCDLADKAGVQMDIKPFRSIDGAKDKDGNPKYVGYSYDARGAFPPPAVLEWAGIEQGEEYLLNRLSRWNDTGMSFDELAEAVERLF